MKSEDLMGNDLVGVMRLELTASWSRTKHATKLRYTPKNPIQMILY